MQGFVAQASLSPEPASLRGDQEAGHRDSAAPTSADSESDSDSDSDPDSSELALVLTLISRRSVRRAGLRYLRRGVDDEGNTANAVESEQLLATAAWDRVFSHVQVRGSIPLFFSQSPYSLRPRPVLLLSEEANAAAMRRHFVDLQCRYAGPVHAVNLVGKAGPEAVVGDRFGQLVAKLNSASASSPDHNSATSPLPSSSPPSPSPSRSPSSSSPSPSPSPPSPSPSPPSSSSSSSSASLSPAPASPTSATSAPAAATPTGDGRVERVGWTWFDFHAECRGMRFEHVGRLFAEIGGVLDDDIGFTEERAGTLVRRQRGVLRTNCMDCLDRTNVVQSAAARRVLELQLAALGATLPGGGGGGGHRFNHMWADNGDAISRQYASTAALKGDYTRTNRRNLGGALTDLGLTLSRFFNNIVSDYFTQAAIDFLLGNVSAHVFDEFEARMTSADPSLALSLQRLRQNAVDAAARIVLADAAEQLLYGGTFLCPRRPPNAVAAASMHERVLLVTSGAAYLVAFDFELEKVASFERVPRRAVREVQWGVYITSTLAASATDEQRNVGFVIRFAPGAAKQGVAAAGETGPAPDDSPAATEEQQQGPAGQWAFKVPLMDGGGEKDVAREVAELFCRPQGGDGDVKVWEGDVVSLDQARKDTGLVERWGYAVRRLVWA